MVPFILWALVKFQKNNFENSKYSKNSLIRNAHILHNKQMYKTPYYDTDNLVFSIKSNLWLSAAR